MTKNPFKLDRVSVRLVKEPPLLLEEPLNSPEKAVDAVAEEIKFYDREVVAVINVQQDNRPINMTIVSIGQLESAVTSPRDLLKSAILSNAAGIIMLHNHPSGSLKPSAADVQITDKVKTVCSLIGVQLLDHIIVGREKEYYSFREKGIMPNTNISFAKDIKDFNLESTMCSEKQSTLQKLKEPNQRNIKAPTNRKKNGPER